MVAVTGTAVPDATLVDVQRFCLHDGPGIRTTVFFKGCPLRCRWCQNPEAIRPGAEMAFYAERCVGAGSCASVCPEDAILPGPDRRIDVDRCTACGACAEACDHRALRLVGRRMDVDTLVAEVLKDRHFHVDSGGGVTLSGGEPMVHAPFLAQLLPRLKAHDVHVVLQTCGVFPWRHMAPLLAHLDLVQFDLKHMDHEVHRRLTGAGNRAILDNFRRLATSPVPVQPRMPVIPGHNDDPDNIEATARFLLEQGHDRLHCLAHHHLGEAKLPRIAPVLEPLHLSNLDPQELDVVARRFTQEGVHVVAND